MSQAMVAGDGSQYLELSVFIKSLNLWSFTIAKGHLLSAIQQIISTLGANYQFSKGCNTNNIPCLCVYVLTMQIGDLLFANAFKSTGDASIPLQPGLGQNGVCAI